jgi:hypothetical protein
MHMWQHVTNHLIISYDKDSNSENRIKLRVRDNGLGRMMLGTDGVLALDEWELVTDSR